ncbi:pyrroloquinoline quinone biosynthesis peptide chaperone PqqD [Streptoverticillium reticulum]|uniref:pyrroloquinoline quinone biosynthesis peptide chaperone PqqD n=1 Tax=Streptoverticillium reticulum TaxID=1433415 RepID=UPI0039BFA2A6
MAGGGGVRWRLCRGVRLGHDTVRDTGVLLHPEGVLLLNETGVAVLALCDGTADVDGIAAALSRRYAAVDAEDVERFVLQLARRRLIETDSPTGAGR